MKEPPPRRPSLSQKTQARKADRTAKRFFADRNLFPQTLDVLQTRSQSLGVLMETGDPQDFQATDSHFTALVSFPSGNGEVPDTESFLTRMREKGLKTVVVTDLLSLCLLKSPGDMGADVALGSCQRFGVPLFFGGPSAAFFATKKEYARLLPGRIVGVSRDRHKQTALRLALQTREQHIRRERATSNICTSQALLATIAGFYAVYHGPKRLKNKALRIHYLTKCLKGILDKFPGETLNKTFFDTLRWKVGEYSADKIQKAFWKERINIGRPESGVFILDFGRNNGRRRSLHDI